MNTTNIATHLIAGALFSALVSSFSANVNAAEATTAPQKTVRYADLNPSTVQGASTLYRRIELASQEVCSPLDAGDLASKMRVKVCMHKAITDAVRQVNQPALSALYDARNGGSLPMIASAK